MRLYDLLPEIYKDKETEQFWDILQTAVDELELSAEEIKNLLDVDKAKEEWLVNIASNLGVDLSKDFPISNRKKIAKAIDVYKLAGTKEGLKLLAYLINSHIEIKEWFEYNGQPYYFKVYIDNIPSEDSYNKLINLINEYKNLRSYLELLGVNSQSKGSVYTSTFLNRGKKYDLGIHFEIPDEVSRMNMGFATIKARNRNISVSIPSINIKTSNSYIASTLQYARKTTIEVA